MMPFVTTVEIYAVSPFYNGLQSSRSNLNLRYKQSLIDWLNTDQLNSIIYSLKLNESKLGNGSLLVCGAKRVDSEFASIDSTDDLTKFDGQIIDCYFDGS